MKIDFARPDREHEALGGALEEAAARVLRSGRSILGDEVVRFERAFAASVGASFAVGVSSGTDGLATALHALGVGEGDEVIVGAFGFVAAPEAVLRVGARPVFVDVEPSALALDAARVGRALSSRTRAIVSVDLFGVVHDLEPIRRVAPRVPIVEDAAQALGATLGASNAGTLGDIGVYSFFPGKSLGAAGDAGACVTNDIALASRMAQVRTHGAGKTYAWEIHGGNYRMDALQAAILGVKLAHLPARLARRKEIGQRLAAAARRVGFTPLVGAPSCNPAFVPLVLRVPADRRDALLAALRARDIDARVHYPTTLPACPPFSAYATGRSFPEADRATRELLSVPCHPEMTEDELTCLERALQSLNS
jgi:dTDP-4-amino-4,6-dideoxygalactose transaminase